MAALTDDIHPRGGRVRLLALHVAAGKPITEAAQAAGMSLPVAHRWLRKPQVLAQVREARDQILDQTVGKLADLVPKALSEMEQLLACPNAPVRLGAAKAICEYALRFTESHALASRIAALESSVIEAGSTKSGN